MSLAKWCGLSLVLIAVSALGYDGVDLVQTKIAPEPRAELVDEIIDAAVETIQGSEIDDAQRHHVTNLKAEVVGKYNPDEQMPLLKSFLDVGCFCNQADYDKALKEESLEATLEMIGKQMMCGKSKEDTENAEKGVYRSVRVKACKALHNNCIVKFMLAASNALDTTFAIAFGGSFTFLTYEYTFGIAFTFGDKGQFACTALQSHGQTFGLLGGGVSASVAFSPREIMGGWSTVGAALEHPFTMCISVGFSIPGISFSVDFTIATGKAIEFWKNPEAAFKSMVQKITNDAAAPNTNKKGNNKYEIDEKAFIKALLLGAMKLLADALGITAIGFTVGLGFDILDLPRLAFLAVAVPPFDFSWAFCQESNIWCTAPSHLTGSDSCDGLNSLTIAAKNDGDRCLLGSTCNECDNPPTFWPDIFHTACGNMPCWPRGTVCGHGTTCKSCCGVQGVSGFVTKCGAEPKSLGNGQKCDTTDECQNGKECLEWECSDKGDGRKCYWDSQCNSGWCDNRKCRALKTTGQVADKDQHCQSGTHGLWNDRGKGSRNKRCCPTKHWTSAWFKGWCVNLAKGSDCIFNDQCSSKRCSWDKCK